MNNLPPNVKEKDLETSPSFESLIEALEESASELETKFIESQLNSLYPERYKRYLDDFEDHFDAFRDLTENDDE